MHFPKFFKFKFGKNIPKFSLKAKKIQKTHFEINSRAKIDKGWKLGREIFNMKIITTPIK
jgi:hypothetical protein